MSIEPHPHQPGEDPDATRLINAIQRVMGPQPTGGWLSGPCPTPTEQPSDLPEFNPSFLVHEVRRLLAEHGIRCRMADSITATIAAGDLLRALGCSPSSAPWRTR